MNSNGGNFQCRVAKEGSGDNYVDEWGSCYDSQCPRGNYIYIYTHTHIYIYIAWFV